MLSTLINEHQDPAAVDKVVKKLNDLLTNGEEIMYVAVQKKPLVNLSPDCVALTNKRIFFVRPKNLGFSMEFQDYVWKDVSDCHIKESMLGSEFTLKTIKGGANMMDYLPKAQARKLYQFAQEKEEEQREYRRQREMEEMRAAAGGVVFNAQIPSAPVQASVSAPSSGNEELISSLQKLKSMSESGLITEEEYSKKKSEILAKL